MGILCFCGCGDDAIAPIFQTIRSADPLHKSEEWTNGPDALVTPELMNGNPAHNLSPAQLIYFCARENGINPVLLLALLENQDLLSQGDGVGDLETRLYQACNLEVASGKYGGFFPQLVASTFQFWLDRSNGLNFRQSYENNFDSRYSLNEFIAIYAQIAGAINLQFGFNYPTTINPDNTAVYDVYPDLTINQIQSYLDNCPNTALKRKTLFQEVPLTNSIQYQ